MRIPAAVLALAAALAAPPAAAQTSECGTTVHIQALGLYVLALQGQSPPPLAEPAPVPDMAAARCAQDELAGMMEASWGAPVGWKVGLTSKPAQEMFGAEEPVFGRLLQGMLLPDGSSVRADFGARPAYEPDLLVRVVDPEVNEARTPTEVAPHLSEVIPFIELPDLVLHPEAPLGPAAITAINVGARLGVMGEARAVDDPAAWAAALGSMTVVTEATGTEAVRAPGKAVLGHPLEAVIWLAGRLKAEGRRLEAGDLVSLGSFGRPVPPEAGTEVTVTYEGVPGGPMRASVRFTE